MLFVKISRICRCKRLMRFIPSADRRRKVFLILSAVLCRNENTDNPVVRKSVSSIDRTLRISAWHYKKCRNSLEYIRHMERPVAVFKENALENRSKVQEVKRPVTSEKSNAPVIKRQQKMNVEQIEKVRPLSSYEKNHQNDGANRHSIKSQSVQTVQKSQVHKDTNRKVVSKKGQKKK